MDSKKLSPAVLAALGLAAVVPAGAAADSGDTGDTGMDVCLSPVACLCACQEGPAAPAALWALPLMAFAVARRRSRAQVAAGLAEGGTLPADVVNALKRRRGDPAQ